MCVFVYVCVSVCVCMCICMCVYVYVSMSEPGARLQAGLGDGGKWVCGVRTLLQQRPCVVYSFGSNGEANFELSLARTTGCACRALRPGSG